MAKDKRKKKIDKKIRSIEKTERKQTKAANKQSKKKTLTNEPRVEPEEDLEAILEQFQREQEEKYAVHEESLIDHPSRRVNASFVPGLNDDIYMFGGEIFNGSKSTFFNDLLRYDVSKGIWKKYASGNSPGPRSSHQTVVSPDGHLWLFGGEFSAGNTFFHYRDFWCLDLKTHEWDRFEFKNKPTARSGHRMALWKNFLVLFGGFFDLGIQTKYLDDLWLFDLLEYKWTKLDIPEISSKPVARSGFSFLPCTEGVVLYGGYSKKYTKGERAKGIFHTDCWLLRMSTTNLKEIKWEKRKKVGYAPGPRVGCTMALHKGRGFLFGGVWDEEDPSGEDLISTFYNDMYSYQLENGGRWWSVNIKRNKSTTKKQKQVSSTRESDDEDMDTIRRKLDEGIDLVNDGIEVEEDIKIGSTEKPKQFIKLPLQSYSDSQIEPNAWPSPRYNCMYAVVKNILYLYGGLIEIDNAEYTLDDFWSLSLDKLDGFKCIKACEVKEQEWNESDDEEDDDDDEEEDEDDEDRNDELDDDNEIDDSKDEIMLDENDDNEDIRKETTIVNAEIQKQALEYFKLSPEDRDKKLKEESLSTPKPGETLRDFYARTTQYWAQIARERNAQLHTSNSNGANVRGKALRRDGFQLAQDRYQEMKPFMDEVLRLQCEAEAENAANSEQASVGGGGSHGVGNGTRNRR